MVSRPLGDELERAVALIAGAPFYSDGWDAAILAMSQLAGGWGAQLFAQSQTELRFNLAVNLPDEAIRDYVDAGGADPLRSPRLRATLNAAPMMKSFSDADYMRSEYRRQYSIYTDFYDRYDAYYACTGRIETRENLAVTVASLRDEKSGDYDRADRDAFEVLLPHIRNAFSLQLAIEGEAARMAVDSMASVGMAAMVCDPNGRLISCSPPGDELLSRGDFLSLRTGVVVPADPNAAATFSAALRLAGSPVRLSTPPSASIVLKNIYGWETRRAHIAPFPTEPSVAFSRGVLIAVPMPAPAPSMVSLMTIGLTYAEAEVALAAAQGQTAAEIAQHRHVSRETVRSQIKSAFAKLGVNNTTQLAARLNNLR